MSHDASAKLISPSAVLKQIADAIPPTLKILQVTGQRLLQDAVEPLEQLVNQ